MPAKVYVETSVIGAYYDERTDIESVAQRHWSRKWWDEVRPQYEVVISQAIVDELSHPGHPKSGVCLALVAGVPRLPVGDEVREVVRHDIAHQIMPQDPVVVRCIWLSPPATSATTCSRGTVTTSPTRTSSGPFVSLMLRWGSMSPRS